MTVKYSAKFKNMLMGGRSARSILEDCILYLHGGTPPTNPEDLRSGTKYCKITTDGSAVASTDRSTPQIFKLVPSAGFTEGNTLNVTVTVDSVTTSYDYTIVATDTTSLIVAASLARFLNDIPEIQAICEIDAVNIWVQCRIAGLVLSLSNVGGSYAVTITDKQSPVRVKSLQFGAPASGVISMETGAVWEGTNLASGTVGYFTLAWPSDDLLADSAYAYPRVQGTAAAVGGDITIDPATVVISATTSVTSFTLTLPTS